jgi:uncharacterized membrane protein YedE/YeeE
LFVQRLGRRHKFRVFQQLVFCVKTGVFSNWFSRPLLGGQFLTQPASWNRQTVIGSAIFGVGLGLSGVCPGPALAALGTGNTDIFGLWVALCWVVWPMA